MHRYRLPAGSLRLADENSDELAPRGVANRLGQAVVLHHVLDLEAFVTDHIERRDQLVRLNIRVIGPGGQHTGYAAEVVIDARLGRVCFGKCRQFGRGPPQVAGVDHLLDLEQTGRDRILGNNCGHLGIFSSLVPGRECSLSRIGCVGKTGRLLRLVKGRDHVAKRCRNVKARLFYPVHLV